MLIVSTKKLSLRTKADVIENAPVNGDNKSQLVSDLLSATIALETELMKMHRMGVDAYKSDVKLSAFESALKRVNSLGKDLSDDLFFSTLDLFS